MTIDPGSLHIRHYPDPVLRRPALPVPEITQEVRDAADRMIQAMFEAEGIGLAAPQVGLSWRLFVAHVPESEGRSASDSPPSATRQPVVYINPVLSNPAGPPEPYEEGCLSLPDIRGDVLRPPTITITAMDLQGQRFTQTATGLLARCWQHEVDHLDGTLIIDRMVFRSKLKNRVAIKELERSSR